MNRDLRTGGTWTPLQRLKNDVVWALATVALGATGRLSPRALRTIGHALGVAAHSVARAARATAIENIARVFPELDARGRAAFARASFAALGETLGDTVALLHGRGELLPLAPQARAVIEQARAEGRGVVFASAHLGPWERVAASLVAEGVPIVTLARESYDPRFSRLYERLRGASGVRVVWRASPGAGTRIVRTLRGGGVLGMPMDLRARVPCCDVPFLGQVAPTPVGPARVALRTRAAVVVGTIAPRADESAGLHVTATRISTEGLGTDEAAPRALTARINDELSLRILALPQAWVWPHERWTDHRARGV